MWTLAVATAIVKIDSHRHANGHGPANPYARGLFWAVTAPLFITRVALRAWLFCRSAASAPAIRICSIVGEPEADVEASCSWPCVFSACATRVSADGTGGALGAFGKDRKSTRLNSSHRCISYAVFCLKKKIK